MNIFKNIEILPIWFKPQSWSCIPKHHVGTKIIFVIPDRISEKLGQKFNSKNLTYQGQCVNFATRSSTMIMLSWTWTGSPYSPRLDSWRRSWQRQQGGRWGAGDGGETLGGPLALGAGQHGRLADPWDGREAAEDPVPPAGTWNRWNRWNTWNRFQYFKKKTFAHQPMLEV